MDQTDNFSDAFVRENIAYGYDVVRHYDIQKFTAYAILFREIQCKKMDI